jgi:hypothetical protein
MKTLMIFTKYKIFNTAFCKDLLLSFVVFTETISLATDNPKDSGNFSN